MATGVKETNEILGFVYPETQRAHGKPEMIGLAPGCWYVERVLITLSTIQSIEYHSENRR